MTTPATQRKAAERARHKEAGRVAVTVWIYPEDRAKLARYIKRLVASAAEREARVLLLTLRDEPTHKPLSDEEAADCGLLSELKA